MILELPTTLVDYSGMKDDMASMMMETINNMLIEMYASFAHAEMLKRHKTHTIGRRNIIVPSDVISREIEELRKLMYQFMW